MVLYDYAVCSFSESWQGPYGSPIIHHWLQNIFLESKVWLNQISKSWSNRCIKRSNFCGVDWVYSTIWTQTFNSWHDLTHPFENILIYELAQINIPRRLVISELIRINFPKGHLSHEPIRFNFPTVRFDSNKKHWEKHKSDLARHRSS